MRYVIEFIVNDTKVSQEELQVMAEGLVKNFKKRYKHVGVRILPHFSETGFHIGWKLILITVDFSPS
ncbi:MAG: hypothetical protein PWP39_1842 [Pyrococcus sp.]|uniref:hypothetical protein n=1 Tax=Pyrococcus sp. TaxID=33866 RepID=UPI0025887C6D|nr:hypothetical protein [Pyrococcus sp.]MDK2870607.1 hypothetical protein [Pyrococcus sp.]